MERGTFATVSLADVVDLERYPIHDLGSTSGRALVERCRRDLEGLGASDLEGFMRPEAIEPVVAWAMTAMPDAYRTETQHNVYFTTPDPELPVDDPRRIQVRSAKSGLAYDEIPLESPLRSVYESDELTAFVGAALGVDVLHRHSDPLGALNVMYYGEGDELGWHFDGADSVVTLMLQPSLEGGAFEYSPMLRSPDDENADGVRSLLRGDRSGVRSMSGAPGTLALFRGHWSPHHVTPVLGERPRINAVLSYAPTPDAVLSDFTKEMFYGRTA
ncbi:MAG TPA: hypothetical protein VEW90_03650 [Gaiellaceae bacterium]|nr:hypothetical protein [Gaiellaceae bacterium]